MAARCLPPMPLSAFVPIAARCRFMLLLPVPGLRLSPALVRLEPTDLTLFATSASVCMSTCGTCRECGRGPMQLSKHCGKTP